MRDGRLRAGYFKLRHYPITATVDGDKTAEFAMASQDTHHTEMEDKDVRRLEDRIEASNKEAQLRLDAVMARIDGRFGSIDAKFDTITNTISDIKAGILESRSATRAWGWTLVVLIVGSTISIGGLLIGMKQVWIGGVQVGQAISTSVQSPSQAATSDHK